MSVYRVSGTLPYREYQPGDVFETVLDPDVERRALRRNNIELLERSTPALRPGTFTLPAGWQATTSPQHQEA